MTSWGESLRPPPQRRPRPAEHKGSGAERSGQRRRLSHPPTNFPRRGGSSDGAIAGRRSNLRAGRRVFPARPPPPRALCSRVHVARRRFAKSSEPECGWTDRPPRRQDDLFGTKRDLCTILHDLCTIPGCVGRKCTICARFDLDILPTAKPSTCAATGGRTTWTARSGWEKWRTWRARRGCSAGYRATNTLC